MLDKIESSLEQSIRDVAERYGYSVLPLHIAADHVYLFLSAPRNTHRARLRGR